MIGIRTIAAVIAVAREKHISVAAAGLGFYAFNAFIGLGLLVYATITLLGSENFLVSALEVFTGVSGEQVRDVLGQLGSTQSTRLRAIVLAVAISAWSSFQLFQAVESAFRDVYDLRDERSRLKRIVDSLVVLLSVAVALVGIAALGSLFLFRVTSFVPLLLRPILLWSALVVLYLPVFYRFSGEEAGLREVSPGTLFTATGWALSTLGLRAYVQLSSSVDIYGAVGALLLFLTWLYVAGLSVLLGVILNAVLADRVSVSEEWYPFGVGSGA